MGDMRTQTHPLTIGGETYEVFFSLATLDAVLDRYGSLKGMMKSMGIPDEKTLARIQRGEVVEGVDLREAQRAVCFMLATLVNEALEKQGDDRRLSENDVMHSLHPLELGAMQTRIMEIITAGTPTRESAPGENHPKNAHTTPPRSKKTWWRGIFTPRR